MASHGSAEPNVTEPERERKGAITKAGNAHCRHALIQAAWSYRYAPKVAAHLKLRQEGQPPGAVAHAWKAQQRLHRRFTHLTHRKPPQVAIVAVARELIGFLWAAMQDVPAPEPAAPTPA